MDNSSKSKQQVITPRFKAGDRVAERPKASLLSAIRKESRARVAQYSTQRYGTVVGCRIKVLQTRKKTTTRRCVVQILWDGMKTPSEHEQMRICFIEELEGLKEGFFATYDSLSI